MKKKIDIINNQSLSSSNIFPLSTLFYNFNSIDRSGTVTISRLARRVSYVNSSDVVNISLPLNLSLSLRITRLYLQKPWLSISFLNLKASHSKLEETLEN